MNEINKINLSEQTKFRLNEIKKLSKYVTAFDYIEKILIVLSEKSSGFCIISLANVIGAPAAVASSSLTLMFSLTTEIIQKLLSITRNKKKKHDEILMLAKSKLNNIETLVSQAMTDMEISHEESNAIIRKKQKCERMKVNVKNVSEKQENMTLHSVNSKKITSLVKNYQIFCKIKKFYFSFCIYKIYLISAEGSKNAVVHFLRVKTTDKIWSGRV